MTYPERFRRARGDPARAVLEGFHALKHAIRFGAAIEVAVSPDPGRLERLARELASDVAPRLARLVAGVPAETFATLAPVPPPTGVIALARRPMVDAEAMLAAPGFQPVVLLHGPTRPGNVGAVVRVAAAAGAGGVLTTGALDPWQPAALRGSAGLHFALPVLRLDAPPPTSRPIVALDPAGEPLAPGSIPPGALIAFGTERDGLAGAPSWLAAARRVAIPMEPGVSSLNLATAVAVVLYAGRLAEKSVGREPGRD